MSSEKDMDLENLKTIGQRLRYFREKEIGESRERFVQGLDITTRTLERYENDESTPDGAFFTRLNGKYREVINLDWLLAGRGNLYITPRLESPGGTKEAVIGYQDVILERMHGQLDRIYAERDFLKLAALQSLLNLIDPEGEKE